MPFFNFLKHRSLVRCLGVVVGMVAIASAADASIVFINLNAAGSNSVNISGLNAGMADGDPKKEIPNFVAVNELEIFRDSTNRIGLDPDNQMYFATNGGNTSPHNFGPGATIDSTWAGIWENGDSSTTFYVNSSGSFSPNFGPNSYIGFRAQDANSNYYYGYIEVLWNWTGTASTSTFQIVSAAYESTPNTGITIPGGGTVPEPASGVVVAMLMGGAALHQRRRLRG